MNIENFPRPNFVREKWIDLNGIWDFSFDEPTYDKKIEVPFCYQSEKSGICTSEVHHKVWYRKNFNLDISTLMEKRLLLKFGAVDYEAFVYINDKYVGTHRGGHTSFEFDITKHVVDGENIITIKVNDYSDTDKPRGKQTWLGENFACWYTPTTGIWQDVWLEFSGEVYLKRIKATPFFDRNETLCEVFVSTMEETWAEVFFETIPFDNSTPINLGSLKINCKNGYGKGVLALPDLDVLWHKLTWSIEKPNLIGMKINVENDEVHSYFGYRSITITKNKILFNDEILFQRLILDQGYWKESLLTPPNDEAIKKDIILSKQMGFNGARKHQKIEVPKFYYWADKLGFLVWGEMPSCFMFTDNTITNSSRELTEFIERDYNHPSIIAWVTANESWGMRGIKSDISQQSFSNMLLYQAKALDKTRLVSGNDGWEQTSHTDFIGIHDYSLMPETQNKYDNIEDVINTLAENRFIMANEESYKGQPVLLTEYGGIAFTDDKTGWGYYNKVRNEEEFFNRLEPITDFLIKSGNFSGFCYTQLTDVMQETNGLLNENREPKVSVERLNKIFSKKVFE